MKITPAQLRRIIKEEVAKISSPGAAELQVALDTICDDWLAQFDESDPTMIELGRDAWANQVEAACDDLHKKVIELIRNTEQALYNGEYY